MSAGLSQRYTSMSPLRGRLLLRAIRGYLDMRLGLSQRYTRVSAVELFNTLPAVFRLSVTGSAARIVYRFTFSGRFSFTVYRFQPRHPSTTDVNGQYELHFCRLSRTKLLFSKPLAYFFSSAPISLIWATWVIFCTELLTTPMERDKRPNFCSLPWRSLLMM